MIGFSVETCSIEGSVRLVGGQNAKEGRVEYCSGGVWGTVCDNTWDVNDANVVCKQLGYASIGELLHQSAHLILSVLYTLGATPFYNAQFGQGTGPVTINIIGCTGNEQNVQNCTLSTPSSCTHFNDAGLRCLG